MKDAQRKCQHRMGVWTGASSLAMTRCLSTHTRLPHFLTSQVVDLLYEPKQAMLTLQVGLLDHWIGEGRGRVIHVAWIGSGEVWEVWGA